MSKIKVVLIVLISIFICVSTISCSTLPKQANSSSKAVSGSVQRSSELTRETRTLSRPTYYNEQAGIIGNILIAEAIDRQTEQLKRIADAMEKKGVE